MDLQKERSITIEPKKSYVGSDFTEQEKFYLRLAAGMADYCYWCEQFPIVKK